MRQAGSLGVRYAVIIGDEEVASGKLKWKRLSDGSQGEIPIAEVYGFFK